MTILLTNLADGWIAYQSMAGEQPAKLGIFPMVQTGHQCNVILGAGGAVTVLCSRLEMTAERLFLYGEPQSQCEAVAA